MDLGAANVALRKALCVGLAAAWLALGGAPLRASEVRHTPSELVVSDTAREIVAGLPASGLQMPDRLASRRDVFLIATAGGAYFDVTALARPEVSARRVAEALNAGLHGTEAEPDIIRFDTVDGFSAANAGYARVQIGNTSSTLAAPVGRVAEAFRAAGFSPLVVLRVPMYADATALGPAPHQTKHFLWYDLTTAEPAPVRVTARISRADRALGLCTLFFSFLLLPVWLVAIGVALYRPLPVARRRAWFGRLTIGGSIAVVICQAFLVLGFGTSDTARAAADLWFGEMNATTFSLYGMAAIPVLFVAALLYAALDKPLFGPSPDDPPPMPAPERALRRRSLLWFLVAEAILIAVQIGVIQKMPRGNPLRQPLYTAFQFAILFLPIVFNAWVGRRVARLSETMGTTLDSEASAAAELPSDIAVRVDDSREGHTAPGVTVEKDGSVVVSRRLADMLTPEELRFAVAQAVAEAPRLRRWMRLAFLASFLPGLWPVLYVFGLRRIWNLPAPWDGLMIILPSLAAMLPVVFLLGRIRKRNVIASDREALRATGNVGAAENALTALVRDWSAEEPRPLERWAWRFHALNESAAALGLGRA